MTEMEDRVETAIYEACDYALPPHLLRKATRAAIEAMLEPTDEMQAALERYSPNEWDSGMYDVMVRAALGKVDA